MGSHLRPIRQRHSEYNLEAQISHPSTLSFICISPCLVLTRPSYLISGVPDLGHMSKQRRRQPSRPQDVLGSEKKCLDLCVWTGLQSPWLPRTVSSTTSTSWSTSSVIPRLGCLVVVTWTRCFTDGEVKDVKGRGCPWGRHRVGLTFE